MIDTVSEAAAAGSLREPANTPSLDASPEAFEQALASDAVAQSETPAGERITPSDVPPAVTKAIEEIAGKPIAAADIQFYVLPSWSDAGRIDPPLSSEAVRELSQITTSGLAFTVDGVDYAAISEADVQSAAEMLGVPRDEATAYFVAQEIAQAKLSAEDGGPPSAEAFARSEVLGEAVAAAVVPDSFAPLGLAVTWLTADSSIERPPGYEAFLAVAARSLDESLTAAGIEPEGGLNPVTQLGRAYANAVNEAGGQNTVKDSFLDALSQFSDEPEALLGTMIADYAAALDAAAR